MDTDGNGLLVEYVYPCDRCIRSGKVYLKEPVTICPDCRLTRRRVKNGKSIARCVKCDRKVRTIWKRRERARKKNGR